MNCCHRNVQRLVGDKGPILHCSDCGQTLSYRTQSIHQERNPADAKR